MSKQLKPPLKYVGGKTRLANKLLQFIPPHKAYVEACAGSAALFFAKDVSPLEVINDIHSGVVNFYRVLRDPEKYRRFSYAVSLTPYSREEFLFCRDTWCTCEDDVEKAYRWFVMMRQSWGGVGRSFGYSATDGRNGRASAVQAILSAIDRLPEIHERIKGVQVENLDVCELIKKYDHPGTFFYIDPPYVRSTRTCKAYKYEMSDEEHEKLVDTLLNIKGTAMLSGYANPIYVPLEKAGWKRHDFEAVCSTAAKFEKADRKRVESVWIRS